MPDDSSEPVSDHGRIDLEEMWKALLACDWSSLAVIPTDQGVSVQAVVEAFLSTSAESSSAVRCIDARGLDIPDAKRLARELAASRSDGGRAVVVVDPLVHSLSGVHLVQQVNAVLLVVRVGFMDLDSLTSTVAMVGSDRIVGSVTASSAG